MQKREIWLMAGAGVLIAVCLGTFAFGARAEAATAIAVDATDSAGSTTVTPTGISTVNSNLMTAGAPTGNFYYTGSYTFPYSNTPSSPNDWSWGCSLNGDIHYDSSTGISSWSVPDSCIPNGGALIPSHPDLYFCQAALLVGGSTFWFNGAHGAGDACIHMQWNGTNYAGVPAGTPPIVLPTVTSIAITQPTQGTSTPSTTLDIEATYNIGTDLNSFSITGVPPDQIGINFVLQNNSTGAQINLGTDYGISQTQGSYSYSTTTTAAAGDYTLTGSLIGDYGSFSPPSDCTPLPPFQTCQGGENLATLATTLPPITFSLDNGIFPLLGFTSGDRNSLATTTCDVTHIGGCFQNAIAFLFYPDPSDLQQFQFLWFNIQNKPPFGYVTQTINAFSGLSASTTPAFTLPTLPFEADLSNGLGGVLWLVFGVSFIERISHLDI